MWRRIRFKKDENILSLVLASHQSRLSQIAKIRGSEEYFWYPLSEFVKRSQVLGSLRAKSTRLRHGGLLGQEWIEMDAWARFGVTNDPMMSEYCQGYLRHVEETNDAKSLTTYQKATNLLLSYQNGWMRGSRFRKPEGNCPLPVNVHSKQQPLVTCLQKCIGIDVHDLITWKGVSTMLKRK